MPKDNEVIDDWDEGGVFDRLREIKDPYKSKIAQEQYNDAIKRLPQKYIDMALEAEGSEIPRHNLSCLAHAHAYADYGLPVIDGQTLDHSGKPTGLNGDCKQPRGAGWSTEATTDHDKINDRWFGRGEYPPNQHGDVYPYASPEAMRNVCIVVPYGLPDEERFAIYDEDGEVGAESTAALEAKHGPLPKTVTAITGSGGRHLYFRTPNRVIKNTVSVVAQNIDTRGEGGQAPASPSMSKYKKRYTWAPGCAPWEIEMAVAPEWLEDAMFFASKANQTKDKKSKRKSKSKTKATGKGKRSKNQDARGLDNHLADIGDHEGGRGFDGPIYAAACAYFAREGADADAESLVDTLRETILAATCKDDRAERRYATDDYLNTRVEQARAFIAETAEPEPISLTTAQVDEAIAVAGIDKDSTEEEVIAFLRDHIDADSATRKRISVALGSTSRSDGATVYTPNEVSAFWRKLDKDASESEDDEDALSTACGFDPLLHATVKRLIETNEAEPFLFNHLEQPVELRSTIDGHVRFKVQDYDGLSELISRHLKYKRVLDSGASVSVSPPMDVVKNIRHKELSEWTLPLRGLAETPFFDRGGNLVIEPGYHEGSQTYLAMPPDLAVGRVSATPSTEEVEQAKSLLFDALGEFPFDGLTPEDIAAGKSASYANCIGLILLPQMREMIDGPTPGHLINKPSPGTGSGLLLDVASIIWTGKVATTMTVPKRQEEIGKTIIAKLRSGASALIFDNIPDNLDSDDLAMGIAQGCIDARVLGKNDASAVEPVEVRATWIFGGNNVTMSEELMRRMTLITLDARMAEPWKRKDWKHPDLKQWVKAHRSELVWACLTLIQNWIAGGRQPYSGGTVKGTFEQWLACVGGVVEAAGIQGFYSNDEELTETVADASADGLFQLASVMADFKPGHAFYVTGQDGNSIMDILNKGPGGAGDPILIDGWDYKEGEYTNAKRVGARFKKWAGKPQIARRANGDSVMTVEIGFDPDYDGHRKVNFYRLKMRMPDAKDWITAVPARGAPEWEAWQAVCGQAVSDHVD